MVKKMKLYQVAIPIILIQLVSSRFQDFVTKGDKFLFQGMEHHITEFWGAFLSHGYACRLQVVFPIKRETVSMQNKF